MKTKLIKACECFEYSVDCAARLLQNGDIAALPTETVYGLFANAFDVSAIKKVYTAKGRPSDNPLIVHISDFSMLNFVARHVPQKAFILMEKFWPGALSLVLLKREAVPKAVTGGLDTVGVRMPNHPLARAVLARAGVPGAAPSANTSGRPSPTSAKHVLFDLNNRIPLIIDGGQCKVGVESTVLDMTKDTPVILRPGAVTKGMIESAIGRVVVHRGVTEAKIPSSPGMKYTHYSPKANVYFFEGNKIKVAKNIVSLYYLNNNNAVVLCPDDCVELYSNINCQSMGKTAADAENLLFSKLRDADKAGFGNIYFHYAEYMGDAVKNRITKAAIFRERV